VRSTPGGSSAASPSICTSTSSPASRACSTSRSRCRRLGCGARAGASSGRRRMPTSRRISASASRPVCSTTSSASCSRSWSGRRRRRAPEACTVITLTACPTTSWSSRAILERSSDTAARASASLSSSRLRARSSASAACSSFWLSPKPPSHTAKKRSGMKRKSPPCRSVSLPTMIRRLAMVTMSPITACLRSSSIPSRKHAAIAAMKLAKVNVTSLASQKESAAPATSIAAGAAKGKRRRPSSRSVRPASRGMLTARDTVGASAASRFNTSSRTPPIAAATTSASNQ
jgi:hypothetical protein